MKKKKNNIIVITIVIVCLIVTLILTALPKKTKKGGKVNIETSVVEWVKRFGNDFDDSMYNDYSKKLDSTTSFSLKYNDNNYLFIAPIFKNISLKQIGNNIIVNQTDDVSINIEAVHGSEETDLAKIVYDKYKDISADIVVYEKKIGDIVYIHEKNVTNSNDKKYYEERLLINKDFSNDYKNAYYFVQYLLVNNKFDEKMIDEIINGFKLDKKNEKYNSYCSDEDRTVKCEFVYEDSKKFKYNFDTLKYYDTSVSKLGPLPFNYSLKNTFNDIYINLEYNNIETVKQERLNYLNQAVETDIISDKVIVNDKTFDIIKYDTVDFIGREYYYPVNSHITLKIIVNSEGDNIDNIINDFTDFSYE